MNKNLYKVIFNTKRGSMMAVAENTVCEGKSAQNSNPAAGTAQRTGRFGISVLSFSLMAALGLVWAGQAQASGIRADRSAPGQTQATVLQTANGLPQVNIQTPSAAGVSLNQFRQFDVDKKGALLNNSRVSVQSRLAGWIQGNPWLASGEARIIVNQVNSTHPSLLNGYIEVAGRRAEVVVANPAGIRVSGGGFINASGVTLTTGKPVFENGALTGYRIRGGDIAVHDGGLDTSGADYTRILSRAAQINAGIWGKDLLVAGGSRDVTPQGNVTAAATAVAAPEVAIDTGSLGGMYAGKITLISSDRGAALHNAGQIFAQAGGVTLSADGKIGNSGVIVASEPNPSGAHIAAVTVSATELSNSGTLSAQGKATLSVHDLYNSGLIASSNELTVSNRNQLDNSGNITAARIDADTRRLNNSGTVSQTGLQDWLITAGTLNNTGRVGYVAENGGKQSGNGSAPAVSVPSGTAAGAGAVQSSSTSVPVVQTLAAGKLTVAEEMENSGRITASGSIDLSVQNGLKNRSELHLNNLTVTGSGLDNQSGKITVQQAVIDTTALDNRQGTLTAAGSLTLRNRNTDNRNGAIQSGGTLILASADLNNQAGQIAAQRAVIGSETVRNRTGSLDAGRLSLNTVFLDNSNGTIRSDSETVLRVSDVLDNSGGQITSARDVRIHDDNRNTLTVQNSGGSILAGRDLKIQAKELAADGTLASGRDLTVSLQSGFRTAQNIEAGRSLNITTQGILTNSHLLQGGQSVRLNAAAVNNTAEGRIQSEHETRISAQNVTNRGVINSNGLTRITAADTLHNIGSGRIYGNHIALGATVLDNREETLNGIERSAAVAARERLDIGAQHIVNQEAAILSSENGLYIGGSLDNENRAQGSAQTLRNASARIEAKGNARIAADNVRNVNNHFAVEEYLAAVGPQIRDYAIINQNTYYQAGRDGTFDNSQGKKDQTIANFILHDGTHIAAPSWNVRDYHINTYKERITSSKPGEIIVGANATFSGSDWHNHNSLILVGGTLSSADGLNIRNEETQGNGRYATRGQQWDSVTKRKWYKGAKRPRRVEVNERGYNPETKFTHTFDAPVAVVGDHVAALPQHSTQAGSLTLRPNNPNAGGSAAPQIKSLPDIGPLPVSALYTVNPQNPHFLIETDPAFADYRRWLGSDYMLNAFNRDPANMHKRLGDGYYEQRLINEQIARLTGYRRLEGYSNDEAQFKALMDNGITYARQYKLTPGIALTAEQLARLSSDIVWLEAHSHTLADGSTVTVLVPKVYLLPRKGDLNSAGALISAEQIQLPGKGQLENSGTVAGRRVVDLSAQNISNSGVIRGDAVRVQADNLNVTGGSIAADSTLLVRGKQIRIETTTATTGDRQNGRTTVDRVAGLYVNGPMDGILSVEADNIDLIGASVRNDAANGQTRIQAAGRLNLDTVRTEQHETYGAGDDKNHRHVHTEAEAGSQIQAQGDIRLHAGQDLNIRQGTVESQNGHTLLTAGNNINLTEGRRTLEMDVSVHSSSRDILSSVQTREQYRVRHDEAAGSAVGGKKVTVSAGKDLHVRGSSIVSDDLTVLTAGNNISLSAAHNRYRDSEHHEHSESGLSASFDDGVVSAGYGKTRSTADSQSDSTTVSSSQIGSIAGNTQITAGQRLQSEAADIGAGRDVSIQAQEISLGAAYETDTLQQHTQSTSSGLHIDINIKSPEVRQLEKRWQGIQDTLNRQGADERNRAWHNGSIEANTEQFKPAVRSRIGSSDSSSSDSTQIHRAVGSSVNAGGQVHIQAHNGRSTSAAPKYSANKAPPSKPHTTSASFRLKNTFKTDTAMTNKTEDWKTAAISASSSATAAKKNWVRAAASATAAAPSAAAAAPPASMPAAATVKPAANWFPAATSSCRPPPPTSRPPTTPTATIPPTAKPKKASR